MTGLLQLRCFALAVALASLWIPAGASADDPSKPTTATPQLPQALRAQIPGPSNAAHRRAAFHPTFLLRPDGYLFIAFAEEDTVTIAISRPNEESYTAYSARGTVTPTRLEASFGKFGRIAMRFRPSSNKTWIKPHRKCEGAGRFVNRRGVFVGDVDFTGEDRYVSVHAHRAKGVVSGVARKCEREDDGRRLREGIRPPLEGPNGPEVPFLEASWQDALASARFLVVTTKNESLAQALTEQPEGRVTIRRSAFLLSGPPDVLTVNNALTQAHVALPSPFSGSAVFGTEPNGTVSWTGTLAVSFPGTSNFSLTAPPFRASLGTTPSAFLPFQ